MRRLPWAEVALDATFSYDEDGRFTEGLSNDGGGRYFYDSNGFVRESISYQTDSDLQIVGPVSYDVYHYPDEIQPPAWRVYDTVPGPAAVRDEMNVKVRTQNMLMEPDIHSRWE